MALENNRYAGFAPDPDNTLPDPKFYVDFTEAGLDSPSEPDMERPTSIGMTNRDKAPGPYIPTGNMAYHKDVKSMGWFYKWGLGGYAFAGGVAEIQTLTFSAGADADGGDYTISLPDAGGELVEYVFTAVGGALAGDLATQAAGGSYSGWTAVASASDVVFTSTIPDSRQLGAFAPGVSGAAATFAQTTPGEKNLHEIWGNNLRYLDKFASYIGKDEFEHQFQECRINSLEWTVEREFVPFTADIAAAKDGVRPEGPRDLEVIYDYLEQENPEWAMTFENVSCSIGADVNSLVNADDIVKSISLSFENGLDSEGGITIGSRHPRRAAAQERSFSLSMSMFFEGLREHERFWGAPDGPSAQGAKLFALQYTLDGGPYGKAIVTLPKVYYTTVPAQPSGKEEITLSNEIKVLTGKITLEDGVTVVRTPMHIRLQNNEGDMTSVPA